MKEGDKEQQRMMMKMRDVYDVTLIFAAPSADATSERAYTSRNDDTKTSVDDERRQRVSMMMYIYRSAMMTKIVAYGRAE